LLLLSFILIIR